MNDFFELFVKMRQVVEPAFVTCPGNGHLLFRKELTGLPNFEFGYKFEKCFAGMLFKVAAKSGRTHAYSLGNFFKFNGLVKVSDDVFLHFVEPVKVVAVG